jgi:DNA-binding IclR family transcriptional regulator
MPWETQLVRAVERALAIFDAFDMEHQSLSLQEIGERIGMAKATTFRLVNTLLSKGFLVRQENQQYCLSMKVLRLAGLVKATMGLREIVRPTMLDISRQIGETVTLNVRSGTERICLDVVETPSALMSVVRPGERVSLNKLGATGRVLLAYCSDAELDVILAEAPNGKGIDRKALERDLARIRAKRFAFKSGDRLEGLSAASVPLFGIEKQVRHSMSVSGPSVRMDHREREITKIMVQSGSNISEMLGGPVAAPSRSA